MPSPQPAPTRTDDLAYSGICTLRAAFAERSLTPRDVLEAQLDRIAAYDHRVRAITDLFEDSARAAADEAARRWRAGSARPLEGITVAIKEEQPIAGQPLVLGSTAIASRTPTTNHPIVDRIVAAGGIVHARTTTPEFCAAGVTRSRRWGVTRNPWDLESTSGGSSGGSASALAAGFTTLATGSDIAGSIRIPAAFCGVTGYKPPYGRVPALRPHSLDDYCHDGPMARTVADTTALFDVIAGRHPDDLVSIDGEPIGELTEALPAGLRVGVVAEPGDYPIAAEVRAGVERAADALSAAGADIVDLELPWKMTQLTEAAFAHYGMIMAPYIRAELGEAYPAAEAYTRDFVETSEAALRRIGSHGAVLEAVEVQRSLVEAFTVVDAIVVPTTMVACLDAEAELGDHRTIVDGRVVELVHHLQIPVTIPFNMASRLPVFAVPSGRDSQGRPVSVQVAAPPGEETRAAALAAAIERATGLYTDRRTRPQLD